MNSPLPDPTAETPGSRSRWWHWLLFLLPSFVCVGTTWVLTAQAYSQAEASGDSYWRQHAMLYTGIAGLTAGAVCCVVSGLVLGFTTKAGHPVLASLGWTALCVVVNLSISVAGCGVLERHLG